MFSVPHDRSVLEPIWARGGFLPPSPGLSLPCTPAPSLCLVFNLNWRDRKPTLRLLKKLRWSVSPRGRERGRVLSLLLGTRAQGRRGGKGSEAAGQTDGSGTFCPASWERGYDHDRGAGIKSNQLRDQEAVWAVSC